MYWLEVCFKLPIKQNFSYVSSQCIHIGQRVLAPFGHRELVGFVVSVTEEKPLTSYEVKPIVRIIDKSDTLFDIKYLPFAEHVSRYNFCSLGEALFAMTPAGKREMETEFFTYTHHKPLDWHQLNPNQQQAVTQITQKSGWYYLFGHTGSGKSAVFLEVIAKTIKDGKQAIYLLPEIALVQAHHGLLVQRFGKDRVAVLHSGLTPSKRLHQWQKIKQGQVDIVLGVRSAIFAPVPNLGVIIIDEEHDPSYKSQATPRYHARQIAMYLSAPNKDITLVMGSATPSLEAYYAMEESVITRVDLSGFAGGGKRSRFEIVDMTKEESGAIFSQRLIDEVWLSKKLGRQSAIYINRRGYERYYLCPNCQYEAFCPHCSVSLTYHKRQEIMQCHYCGYREPKIEACPACGSVRGGFKSFGVEMVEKEAKRIFSGMKIVRLDSDVVKENKDAKKTLEAFYNGEADILIGTQMVAKGFNFPHLRLVAIALADVGLNLPDFRARERLFTFLQQVSGRTGRYDDDGLVLAQSYVPTQPALQYSLANDTEGFLKEELSIRKELGFPPYTRMLRLVFRGTREVNVLELAEENYHYWNNILRQYGSNVMLLGPNEAILGRIAGKYRWQLLFQIDNYNQFMKIFIYHLDDMPKHANVYCEIEHDPVILL